MASPVFAEDENAIRDELIIPQIINELPSRMTTAETQPVVEINKTKSKKSLKNIFTRNKKAKNKPAKELNAIEPQVEEIKTIEKVQKEQKKKIKLAKKQKKAEKKNKTEQKEIPAVTEGNSQTVLTDTAYQGSIETNKIIEVNDCVKIAL